MTETPKYQLSGFVLIPNRFGVHPSLHVKCSDTLIDKLRTDKIENGAILTLDIDFRLVESCVSPKEPYKWHAYPIEEVRKSVAATIKEFVPRTTGKSYTMEDTILDMIALGHDLKFAPGGYNMMNVTIQKHRYRQEDSVVKMTQTVPSDHLNGTYLKEVTNYMYAKLNNNG